MRHAIYHQQEELESMPWRETAASMLRPEDLDVRVPKVVPDSYFELQHVLGYSGDHLKDNVHHLSNGKAQNRDS